MNAGLQGKVVAVTGGSSGIGKAFVEEFANNGTKIAVCGRRAHKLRELEETLIQQGTDVFWQCVDVSKPEEISAFVEATFQHYGHIDVWINNAGIDTPHLVGYQSVDESLWDSIIDTDLKGSFFGSKYVASKMSLTGGGVIINISSFASLIPTAGRAVYSCAKAGMNSLTKTLAAEMAPDGIRVVAIIPGYIKTEMTSEGIATRFDELVSAIPAGRLGEVWDLTKAAVFLASEEASYISGVCLEISGAKFAVQNPRWAWQQKEKPR